MYKELISFIHDLYGPSESIPLHRPYFLGNEKKYLNEVIDSTYVSSIGEEVRLFEQNISLFTGVKYAIAVSNGTSALHLALRAAGVEKNSEVLTQSLTFVATCNAIRYCGAEPIFIDVSSKSASLDKNCLQEFLLNHTEIREDGYCWNKRTQKKIIACLPMHTFGLSAESDEIWSICKKYNIKLIEDCAESLGSFYKKRHTGYFGDLATLSFNGNKIITTGGGGMVLTNKKKLAEVVRHLSTTAKKNLSWDFYHDQVGFNYRMPNLNAALGLAQLELLPKFLENKRGIAKKYHNWGEENGVTFLKEPENTKSNYWLNILISKNESEKNKILKETNKRNIYTRPAWIPMHKLPMFKKNQKDHLSQTNWFFERIVSLPSSINIDEKGSF